MTITTQGNLQEAITSMNVGDYIAANYTATDVKTIGTFSDLGEVDTEESSLVYYDVTATEAVLSGCVILTKVDTGVLLTNNLLFSGVAYLDMNKQNLIAGTQITIGDINFLVRVPSIKELMKADSTFDGLTDIADAPTNFGTNTTNKELIQENYNLSQGLFTWSNTASATTANAAANTATGFARLALLYIDNTKSTDLFH